MSENTKDKKVEKNTMFHKSEKEMHRLARIKEIKKYNEEKEKHPSVRVFDKDERS